MSDNGFEDPEIALQLDQLCDRFETAWNQGQHPQIEAYLDEVPTFQRAAVLRQLLLIQWDLQASHGDHPILDEWQQRFAEDGTTVADAWQEFQRQFSEAGIVDNRLSDPMGKMVAQSTPEFEQLGRFRLRRLLGQGAYGRVYLAHDQQLRRDVAIKVPSSTWIAQWKDSEAFIAEARTLAVLDHPHIVPVYDVGSAPDCPCFVVSKFMDGADLRQLIKSGRPTLEQSAKLVATIAEALQYAHEQKIVHRDIKPANILLDAAGRPHIADFGLALNYERYGQFQGLVGTPAYMSPEQVNGEGHLVDGRADIFSLGVVFYELLTGERPFRARDHAALLDLIATVDPRPPRQLDGTIPYEVERICLKAMSKRPTDRYTTAGDMAAEIRSYLDENAQAGRVISGDSSINLTYDRSRAVPTPDELRASDMVISSAQLDNQPLGPSDAGWVSRFHHNLKVRLEQLLGESIHISSLTMSSQETADEETVIDSVSSAKTLVSVMSPPFTKSPGCVRSVKQYWQTNERSGELYVDSKPRVFKVLKSPVRADDIPAELSDFLSQLFGFEFYEQDLETGRIREFDEVFGPSLKQRFHERVYDLAHDVSQMLRAFRTNREGGPSARGKGHVSQIVYLATGTTDVQEERDRIRRELIERGCVVLPEAALPLSARELERSAKACLEKCTLAIHILGRRYGITPEDCDESVPAMQLRLSARRAQEAKMTRLLWMPEMREIEDQRQVEFLRHVQQSPEMHAGAEMVESDLSLLKSLLIHRLQNEQMHDESSPRIARGAAKLYLLCESRDEQSIELLEEYLFGEGLEVCLPAFDGSEADAIALHRENLVACDALLVYYGAAPRAWVDIKLRDVLKANGYGRAKPLDMQAVFIAPPLDHRKTRFKSLQAQVIRENADGLASNTELNDFVTAVKRSTV